MRFTFPLKGITGANTAVSAASGAPAPWSQDAIFQNARFLNVFREDDRGSQALMRFAKPVEGDLERLVHALFFARWCNRQSSLDALSPSLLESEAALVEVLSTLPPPWSRSPPPRR